MHKLALKMGRTVTELSSSMTTDELASWMAYDRQHPISGFREMDMLFANVCYRMAQFSGAKKKGGGAFTHDDFRIFRPKEVRTPLQFLRAKFGGLVKKKDS